ncbi:MAG: diguanylate cyclase [Ardenticatenales bacterium]|nr:diguanylate cyclase [Ardenticatenales bacterium]
MQILIVDDHTDCRAMLQELLTYIGHEVVEAVDGKNAWNVLQVSPIPLLITDWMMPEMDGTELIRQIRRANLPRYTYIILLTGRNHQGDVIKGLQAGADDYITKPFDLEELRARVAIGERIIGLEADLRRALDKLRVLATHDSLTGLLNRQAIMKEAKIELRRTRRLNKMMSLVMLDIDHFKQVNDTYGHRVGDEVLQLVSKTIMHSVRTYDRVGRWGGEEFLLLLPETPLAEAAEIAERVRRDVAATPLPVPGGSTISLQVSLGVVEADSSAPLALSALLEQADQALYHAKNAGRNRVITAPLTWPATSEAAPPPLLDQGQTP